MALLPSDQGLPAYKPKDGLRNSFVCRCSEWLHAEVIVDIMGTLSIPHVLEQDEGKYIVRSEGELPADKFIILQTRVEFDERLD